MYWIETDTAVYGSVTVRRISSVGADPANDASWKALEREAITVEPDAAGFVECPACGVQFGLENRRLWTGVRHRTCGQRLTLKGVENQVAPVWCVVGNIVDERPYGEGGFERRSGTKHFSGGTKVYCYPPLWGDGYERIKVIGKHRGVRDMVVMIIRYDWITNRRVKLVYAPALVDRLSGFWDGTDRSRKLAEELAGFAYSQ